MKLKQLIYFVVTPLLMDIFTPASTIADDKYVPTQQTSEVQYYPIATEEWICTSEKFCHKDQYPQNLSTIRFESQNDCRLSCGQYGAIWPMPTGYCALEHERVHFDPLQVQFKVKAPTKESTKFLTEVNVIFVANLVKECIQKCASAKNSNIQVEIEVNSESLVLDLETDESYMLSIDTTGQNTTVHIEAETVFGARHGLETLSNLVTGSKENGLLLVSSALIEDHPKFAHRGLLLDTSRNFFPVHYIRKTLDAMATSKLNVFHWHATDTQSFPLEIPSVPEMTRFGAYSSKQTYTQENIRNIVEYALKRGIRVLIEIDGPSHAGNGWQWGPKKGLGNLAVCVNQKPYRHFCIQPPCGQLNPLNDNVYTILKEIYQHLAKVLPVDETMHMGGDEVYIPCWKSVPEITNAMIARGYNLNTTDFHEVWSEFHRRSLQAYDDVTQNLNDRKTNASKDVIIWDSQLTDPTNIDKYLPKERYIIQVWNDVKYADELTAKGYRIIMSNKENWYLSSGVRSGKYSDWPTMYNYRLNQSSLILGGEACMWSEMVDQYSFENRIWPRAGAVAERLWSDPDTKHTEAALRFHRYRERLVARGCNPGVVQVKWCVLNEDQC